MMFIKRVKEEFIFLVIMKMENEFENVKLILLVIEAVFDKNKDVISLSFLKIITRRVWIIILSWRWDINYLQWYFVGWVYLNLRSYKNNLMNC